MSVEQFGHGTAADRPYFVVIEAGAPGAFDRACAGMSAAGLRVSTTFSDARPGVAVVGQVTDERTAQQAVLAALAGAHLVVAASAPREVIDLLCDDLRRLGTLRHQVGGEELELDEQSRALLERLLAGDSLGQAAAALHLSRRTADRRLAAARRALGATTTAEALAIAVRHGMRPSRS